MPPRYGMFVDVNYAQGAFSGELVLTYSNASKQPLDEVYFRLYANARALYGLASVKVHDARVNGEPAPTVLLGDETVLSVRLPEPLAPDASTEIVLAFSGTAAVSTAGRFQTETEYGLLLKTERVFTLTSFYPLVAPITGHGWAIGAVADLGDALFADSAAYDVALLLDSRVNVIPAADGVFTESDGRTLHVFHRDALRDFSLVLVDEDRVERSAAAGGLDVRSWFPPEHGEAGAMALEQAAAAVDAYSTIFGTLPLAAVDLAEVPLQRVAGVELSGLILVSADYASSPRDPFFSVIVAHEVAHQWFYAAVGSDPTLEPWLDEALATYASNLFLAVATPDIARSQYSTWSTLYDRARLDYPALRVTSAADEFPDPTTYSAFVYSGGALELDSIRTALGDESFFAGLADYYASYALSIATGADLLAALQRACTCTVPEALFPHETTAGP